MLDLFDVCSNHAPLNYSRQETKNNLQFMILTYLLPWNEVKVIKPSIDPEQAYNHEKFEKPPLNSVPQKTNVNVLLNEKTRHYLP